MDSSIKRQKGNSGMAQETPKNRRARPSMSDETSDDEDIYEDSHDADEEDDDEEPMPSSSRKVKFDTDANVTFKHPPRTLRRYIPDFDSLPKGGVWVSPAPGRHTEFIQVVVRTTKCDICNEKAGGEDVEKVMQRCNHCNKQFCRSCESIVSGDDCHFPVLAELVWEPQTKANNRTRPGDNFASNMYIKPKIEVRPVRPLTASERLAGMRTILPGSFNTVAFSTPTPFRRPRPSRATGSTKKNKKNKKRVLPPGYTSDEVDAHYELDWEFIQKLPVALQRKEKKEADMRALMRKRNLEVMEAPTDLEPETEPTLGHSRTLLPSDAISRSRQYATPISMATRRSRGIDKSTSEPRMRVDTSVDSETTSEPLRHILDGLAQNRRVAEQAEEAEFEDDEYETAPMQEYDDQEYLQVENSQTEEQTYEPGYD